MKKKNGFLSIDKIKLYNNKLFKNITISILLSVCLLLIYYFHFILKTDVIFTHFFYIPIVLASLWWSYKGIIIAAFLSSILLVVQILSPIRTSLYTDITRAIMFLAVSIIISLLIKKRQLLEGTLRAYGKNLEHRIHEWEESYKKLEESANKPVILIGSKGTLLSLNSCVASKLGEKPENYKGKKGKTLWDIFPKKIADERFNDHQEVIQSRRSMIKEITVSLKRKEYYYLARIQPVKNISGDINSVLILDNDITDKKNTEKALTESEERYRTLFENTGTATIIIEEDRNISMVNTKFEKLTGYSKDEIENKMKWDKFVIPEDLKRLKKYHLSRR